MLTPAAANRATCISEPVERPLAGVSERVFYLCCALMQVHLYPDVELVGKYAQRGKGLITEGERRVRGECRRYEGMLGIRVVYEVGSFLQVFRRIIGPDGWEIHDRGGDDGAHRQVGGGLSDDLREEILVAEAGYASAYHLGYGELSAVPDHFRAYPALFDRPDDVAQPGFEGEIVCKAAKQGHRGMRVGIDEARYQDVIGAFDEHTGLVFLLCIGDGQERHDATVGNSHRMAVEDRICGVDRDDPTGHDQSVTVLHACRSIRIARGGASAGFRAFRRPFETAVSGLSVVLFQSS
jgi:hypothetical protein